MTFAQESSVATPNFLQNGDFESVIAPNYPAKWKHTRSVFGKATYEVRTDDTITNASGNSLFINILRNPVQGNHTIYQNNVKLRENSTYRLSFKSLTLANTGKINIKIHNSASKSDILQVPRAFDITQNSQVFTFEFRTPSGENSSNYDIIFQFIAPNKTIFLFDDAQLTELQQNSRINIPEVVRESSSPFGVLNPNSRLKDSVKPKDTLNTKCDIYVSSVSGNDENVGSNTQPLKTLGRAITLISTNPSFKVVCVDPGDYTEVLVINNLKGTKENPYIIKSTSATNKFNISGDNNRLPMPDCVQQVQSVSDSCLRVPLVGLTDSTYVVLDGMVIQNSSGVGLRLARNSNVTLVNSVIKDNTSFGILLTEDSPQTLISKTTISGNFRIAILKDIPQGAGISMYTTKAGNNIKDIAIIDSTIHDNFGDGIFIGPNSNKIAIEKSTFYDNTKSNISLLNSQNVVISKNILHCSSKLSEKRGSLVYKGAFSSANVYLGSANLAFNDSGSVKNLLVNNILVNCRPNLVFNNSGGALGQNTVINNSFISSGSAEQFQVRESKYPISSNTFSNNLFIQDAILSQPQFLLQLQSQNIFSSNIMLASQVTSASIEATMSYVQEAVDTLTVTRDEAVDPSLLKLPRTSRAVNYGKVSEMLPKDDYFGNTRTSQVDAGAIEYSASDVLGASIDTSSSLTTIPQNQCTKYVSKDGNDTTGVSLETAYKTIQKGVTNLSNKDVLCVKGGTYDEVILVNKKFTSDTKVKIGAYSGGGNVEINAGTEKLPASNCNNFQNLSSSKDQTASLFNICQRKALLALNGAAYVEIIGINVISSSATGIYITDSSNITLSSVNSSKNGLHGVLVAASEGITFDKSRFTENNYHRKANSHVQGTGTDMYDGSKNINIRDSLFYKNYGEGLTIRGMNNIQIHDSAFWDNDTTNLYIRNSHKFVLNRNLIFCSSPGLNDIKSALGNSKDYSLGFSYFGISKTSAETNTIVNSIFQGCKSNMILNGEGENYVRNFNIINNHFINARTNTSDKASARNILLMGSNFPNLKFKNNIIYQKDDSIRTIVGYDARYDFSANLIYPNTIRTLIAPAFITSDPKLNSGNAELSSNLDVSKLSPNKDSPAVNTADARSSSEYLSVDYLKKDRNNLDIGAIEVQGVSNDEPRQTEPDPPEDDPTDPDDPSDDEPPADDPTDPDEDPNDDCLYYWCDNDDEAGNYDNDPYGSYDPYSDGESDPYSAEYDPYEDYYYDFDYDADETAQFGFIEPGNPQEVLKNGSFDLSKEEKGLPAGWFIRTGVDGAVKVTLVQNEYDALAGNALRIQLKKLPAAGRVELFQSQLPLKPGTLYQLSFVARSDFGSDIDISLNNSKFPYELLTPSQYGVDLNPDWREYSGFIQIPENQSPSSEVRLVLSFDGAMEDVYFIDKLALMEVVEPAVDEFDMYGDEEYDYSEPADFIDPYEGTPPEFESETGMVLPNRVLLGSNNKQIARNRKIVYIANF
jgi:parallel beta-helix repeat protein